ncbi:leucine-rich repeat-containing protein (LRR) [Tieghemostelium lacteum]|uniref:Leucine-rich repeat-containing protein (LRR) n=1 Tax=Tieghemostelium lacteum TaxID=361077 RepID=A0A151ZH21_TIELA|nr:leucine-rich repeat-containing protein (LRR) [Tieghemostelium lacteum]|eukprot:KYQ93272.1 leucine-rich repeat-containing protein (LRR) [Tieghemostelium lacteum]
MSEEILTPNDRKYISTLLQQKNQESILLNVADKISKKKNKKPSKRITLITKNRVFFLKPGQAKIKKESHFLDINEIRSSNSNEVVFVCKTFSYGLITTGKADDIIGSIRTIFNQTFLGYPDEAGFKLDVKPPSRLQEIPIKDLPCGGFVETYSSLCDYYQIPIRGDICWDMANIVSSRNIKVFNFAEIELPISPGDIKALLAALKYNTYFKSLVFDGHQLSKDQFTAISETLKTNSTIEDISLNTVSGTSKNDSLPIIAQTLTTNKNLALTSIDISNNQFDDKGIIAFSNYIAASPRGIASLNISSTTNKIGISSVANALKKNIKMPSTLSYLNLSNNKFEADGSGALASFLAMPNALRHLNISNSMPIMDTIAGALVRGCSELRTLEIADIKLTKKEVTFLVQFISASSTLKHLNLSNTKVPVDNLKELVVALNSNLYLQEIILDLRGNDLGIAGARMLASLADKLANIHNLDVSENDFGDEGVSIICEGFCQNTSIKKLVLNGNFKTSKTKSRAASIESVITLLESECPIEILHLTVGQSKSPLKNDILPLVYSLATNDSLLELDISGHQMGNKGAIALGKALQTNKTLHTLFWDDNLIGIPGYVGLQVGLERNLTLKNMPTPLNDICQAYRENPIKLQSIIKEIERCINRNQSPSRAFEGTQQNIGATNLSFLASGPQQNIEKLLNKIKSVGRKATDPDHITVIKDGEQTEKVIGSIHLIKEGVHATLEMELNQKLKDFVSVINDVINKKKNEMTQQILEAMQGTYKSMDQQSYKRLATAIQFGSKDVDETQIHSTLVKGAGAELSQRAHECFISALDIASDYTYEKISLGLESVFKDLVIEENQSANESVTPSATDSPVPTRANQTTTSTAQSSSGNLAAALTTNTPVIPATNTTVTTPTPTPTPTTTTTTTPTSGGPPPIVPRTGAAAVTSNPISPEIVPQPVSKTGAKLLPNSAVASAIAKTAVFGVGGPPPRKPVAQQPVESTPTTTTTSTPSSITPNKAKPAITPRTTTPSKDTKDTKDSKDSKKGGKGDGLSAVPEGDSEELVHITKGRPQMAHKRKPPTRRPRPPTES